MLARIGKRNGIPVLVLSPGTIDRNRNWWEDTWTLARLHKWYSQNRPANYSNGRMYYEGKALFIELPAEEDHDA